MKPRRKRARVAGALVALVAGFAAVEIGLRVVAKATSRERGLTWHRDFGWAYLPDVEKRGEWWSASEPARTNSRGWRDDETPLERTDGVRRVVALGDSFTFGMAVDFGERFTERLERDVRALDVVNLGLNASGTDQQLRILELEGLRYSPDVVVLVALMANDLQDIAHDRKNFFPKPHYVLREGALELVPPRDDWLVRLRCSSYAVELALRPFDRRRLSTTVAAAWRDEDAVPLFAALVKRMHDVAHAAGAHFLVALIYPRPYAELGVPQDELRGRDAVLASGVPTLDTFERFAEAARHGAVLYAPDGHWNAQGHALFAREIASELARRGWIAE